MGYLYKGDYLTSPEAFFCPSQTDPRWQFNTPQNPWPPPAPGGNHTRAGYTCRPTIRWGSGKPTVPMTKLTRVKNKAILADVVGIPMNAPDFTSVHHKKINVMYGDRSARPVDKGLYEANQKLIQGQSTNGAPLSLYIDENDPAKDNLCNNLDKG